MRREDPITNEPESEGKLPESIRKVCEVAMDMFAPDVAVRKVERLRDATLCPFCRGVVPWGHTRDCLDYGEAEWEREAERRDQRDSLDEWL